jgi:hypothetical protein
MKRLLHFLLVAPLLLMGTLVHGAGKGKTLADLKKLQITCLVPSWLPEGYHLKSVTIDYSDTEGLDDPKAKGYPAYSIEYGNGKKGQFTIESARVGIGDRNLDDSPLAEESKFQTELGTVFIIYRPKGETGVKERITANWIEDATIKKEKKSSPTGPAMNGRYHGVSGYGMTLADFENIVRSLHPVREK